MSLAIPIHNKSEAPLTMRLEPWAETFIIKPMSYVTLRGNFGENLDQFEVHYWSDNFIECFVPPNTKVEENGRILVPFTGAES